MKIRTVVSLVAALALFAVAFAMVNTDTGSRHKAKPQTQAMSSTLTQPQLTPEAARRSVVRRHVATLGTEYLTQKSRNPDGWWLTDPKQVTPDKIKQEVVARSGKISSMLEQYAHVTPLASAIAKRFDKPLMTLNVGNGESVSFMNPTYQPNVEICFVPRSLCQHTTTSLYWEKSWGRGGGMMIGAVEWPDKFLPGLIFHELGHGHYFREGRPSSVAPPGSESYELEEVEMHELELAVINAACNGQYVSAIDKIIAKYSATDWLTVLGKLTIHDLKGLDLVVGAESYGQDVSQTILACHYISMGLRAIEKGKQPASEKLGLYQFFTHN